MTPIREQLLGFVKLQHGEQKRKYTNAPYWTHCLSVAELVTKHDPHPLVWEIAVCHDLFEDTQCDFEDLYSFLITIGYEHCDAADVCDGVNDLTDRFTSEQYPELNRAKRKRFEAQRLGLISNVSQSVKYADLINNTSTIVEFDKGFAQIYLKEKGEILEQMTGGNIELKALCKKTYKEALLRSLEQLETP